MGVGDDGRAVFLKGVLERLLGEIWKRDALREEARVVATNGIGLDEAGAGDGWDGGERDFKFLEDRLGVTGQGVLVRVTGALAGKMQAGHGFGGFAVAPFDHPDGAGIATLAHLTVRGAVVGIDADFEAADLLFSGSSAVVDLGDG